MKIGSLTKTSVAVLYVSGVADPALVREVKERLGRIDVDGILESGYLEEYIEDQPWSPFPQVLRTERPDRVAGGLLEGRVAILTDGTPFALIVPAGLAEFISSVEDYYERSIVGSFQRLLRYGTFFVALTLPALYVAVTTFHQELLPTRLMLHIAAQHEGVPFPTFVEALLLEVTFDIIREATIRLPRPIGPAITIVGVLVVGQAAVQAGLVSPFMVIIVAFTGIASFATPIYSFGLAVRILRYGILFLSAGFGLLGVTFALSVLLIHVSALRSFGQPYMAPYGPVYGEALKDSLIRAPWWAIDRRPRLALRKAARRQAPDIESVPPPDEGKRGSGGGPDE